MIVHPNALCDYLVMCIYFEMHDDFMLTALASGVLNTKFLVFNTKY